MVLPNIKIKIEIPEGVELTMESNILKVKGPKGEVERKLAAKRVDIKKEEKSIIISSIKPTKKEKTIVGTFKSHIKNMIKGVQEGYVYKLKVCSGHFPMTVSINNKEVVVKNYFGEKVPRKVKLPENINIKLEGEIITIDSPDKEAAGKAASLIELLMRRPGFDRRVFQDGIYIIEKGGRPVSK